MKNNSSENWKWNALEQHFRELEMKSLGNEFVLNCKDSSRDEPWFLNLMSMACETSSFDFPLLSLLSVYNSLGILTCPLLFLTGFLFSSFFRDSYSHAWILDRLLYLFIWCVFCLSN